jgi:hypothetical protein
MPNRSSQFQMIHPRSKNAFPMLPDAGSFVPLISFISDDSSIASSQYSALSLISRRIFFRNAHCHSRFLRRDVGTASIDSDQHENELFEPAGSNRADLPLLATPTGDLNRISVARLRQLLRHAGGSRSRLESSQILRIRGGFETIKKSDFSGYRSATAVNFASPANVREIDGFEHYTSLSRIEIPSSVEIISSFGFEGCTSLSTIVFSTASHLRMIDGFQACTSLCRIDIPSFVEIIS